MKFGRHLNESLVPEWETQYMSYKPMKKLLAMLLQPEIMQPNWSLESTIKVLKRLEHRFNIDVPTTVKRIAMDLQRAGVAIPLTEAAVLPLPEQSVLGLASGDVATVIDMDEIFGPTQTPKVVSSVTAVTSDTTPTVVQLDAMSVDTGLSSSRSGDTDSLTTTSTALTKATSSDTISAQRLAAAISFLPSLDVICAIFSNIFLEEVEKVDLFFESQLEAVEARWEKIKFGCSLLKSDATQEVSLKRYADVVHILSEGTDQLYALVYHLINFSILNYTAG